MFQFFQPFTQQALVVAGTAIHCVVFDYASGKMLLMVLTQNECRDTYCPWLLIEYVDTEATGWINYTGWGALYPVPPRMVPQQYDRHFSISSSAAELGLAFQLAVLFSISLFQLVLLNGIGTPWPWIRALLLYGRLCNLFWHCTTWMGAAPMDRHASIPVDAPSLEFMPTISFRTLLSPSVLPMCTLQSPHHCTPAFLVAHLDFLWVRYNCLSNSISLDG